MSLIAHFVFDKGGPVDVRLMPSQKYEFIKEIKEGNIFYDKEGEGVFYANLKHVRFFYISNENLDSTNDILDKTDNETIKNQNFDDIRNKKYKVITEEQL